MKAKYLLVFFKMFFSITLNAELFNFSNNVSINLPNEFEILSITQNLRNNPKNNQYWYSISFWFVFQNKNMELSINLFGNNNIESVIKNIRYNESEIPTYSVLYNLSDQIKYLLNSYSSTPYKTSEKINYSVFRSPWGSGISIDYVGYYLKIPNPTFNECIINLYDSWDALGSKNPLSIDNNVFNANLNNESTTVKTFYTFLESIISQISFNHSNSNPIYYTHKISKLNQKEGYLIPTQKGLRLREKPSISAPIITELPDDRAYIIIDQGGTEEINGKKGQWVRIVPLYGSLIGWTFNAYLRPITDNEYSLYIERD